jgi:hypothetical protein
MDIEIKKELKKIKPLVKKAMRYEFKEISLPVRQDRIKKVVKYFEANKFKASINEYNELEINLERKQDGK